MRGSGDPRTTGAGATIEIGVGDASYKRRRLLSALDFPVFVRKPLRRNEFGFWRGSDYRELDFLMQ